MLYIDESELKNKDDDNVKIKKQTDIFNDISDIEQYPVCIGYGDRPDLIEGYRWREHTIEVGKSFVGKGVEFRRCVFFLIHYNVAEVTKVSEQDMFREIRYKSGLDKSTILDYVKAAKVESSLNITQGVMSVDALTYLAENANESDWKTIFDLGMRIKEEASTLKIELAKNKKKRKSRFKPKTPNDYLTKTQVNNAIREFNKLNKHTEYSEDQSSPNNNIIPFNGISRKTPSAASNKLSYRKKKQASECGLMYSTDAELIKFSLDEASKKCKAEKIKKAKARLFGLSLKQKNIVLDILCQNSIEERLCTFLLKKLKPDEVEQLIEDLSLDIIRLNKKQK